MGRLVTCGDDIVWKYAFGEQSSEIYRVPKETGIGKHHFVSFDYDESTDQTTWTPVDPSQEEFNRDVLILDQSDAEGLAQFATGAQDREHFHDMLQAFADYIKSKPDVNEFVFQGEM